MKIIFQVWPFSLFFFWLAEKPGRPSAIGSAVMMKFIIALRTPVQNGSKLHICCVSRSTKFSTAKPRNRCRFSFPLQQTLDDAKSENSWNSLRSGHDSVPLTYITFRIYDKLHFVFLAGAQWFHTKVIAATFTRAVPLEFVSIIASGSRSDTECVLCYCWCLWGKSAEWRLGSGTRPLEFTVRSKINVKRSRSVLACQKLTNIKHYTFRLVNIISSNHFLSAVFGVALHHLHSIRLCTRQNVRLPYVRCAFHSLTFHISHPPQSSY